MNKRLVYRFTLVVSLFLAGTLSAEDPWTFISIPDFLNNDVDSTGNGGRWTGDYSTNPEYFNPGEVGALPYVIDKIGQANADFVLVAGDLHQGRWSLDRVSSNPTVEQRISHLNTMADTYYPAWTQRWTDAGFTLGSDLLAIPGDHEYGDNDWNSSYDRELIPIYAQKFSEYMNMPTNGPIGYQGRSWSLQHKNLTLVGVDVYETDADGDMAPGVTGTQLDWVDQTLSGSAGHKIVMGHMPVLPGYDWRSSSAMGLPGDADTGFWQSMDSNDVSLYLCGEVHTVSAQQKDNILQLPHGSQPSKVSEFNYLEVTVYDDRLELTIKALETTIEGPNDFDLDPYGADPYVERIVKLTADQQAAGFQSVGTMTIDLTGPLPEFLNQTGILASKYTSYDRPAQTITAGLADSLVIEHHIEDYATSLGTFGDDVRAYSDRGHNWVASGGELPEALVGGEMLLPSTDDSSNPYVTMSLTLKEQAKVYVLMDGENLPNWLTESFTETGWEIALDKFDDGDIDEFFGVYEAEFLAGETVLLGENSTDAGAMYSLVMTPTPEPVTLGLLGLGGLGLLRPDRRRR